MKTHRSTQLFLYCSAGERSVKCVRPALEMEESKEEQRAVVRFMVAERTGTREIHRRMPAACGEQYVSDKCARVAEKIPRRTHITARRFAPGTDPSSLVLVSAENEASADVPTGLLCSPFTANSFVSYRPTV